MADVAQSDADHPVHAALMHNRKVLIVSGSGNLPTNSKWQAAILIPPRDDN